MNLIEIIELDLSFDLPTRVEELTQDQYLSFLRLLESGEFETEDELKLEMLYAFSPLEKSKKPLNKEAYNNLFQLVELLDDFFETQEIEGKTYRSPVTETVKSMVREFTYEHQVYAGPDDALINGTIKEFVDCFSAYQDYQKSKDNDCLRRLAAILFREKVDEKTALETGDLRVKYNPNKLNRNTQLFENLPIEYLKSTYYFFSAFLSYIMNNEVNIGGENISLRILFKGDPTQKKSSKVNLPGTGFVGVLFTVAESGVFGNMKSLESTNMWTVFARLYQVQRDRLEELANSNKNSNDNAH